MEGDCVNPSGYNFDCECSGNLHIFVLLLDMLTHRISNIGMVVQLKASSIRSIDVVGVMYIGAIPGASMPGM